MRKLKKCQDKLIYNPLSKDFVYDELLEMTYVDVTYACDLKEADNRQYLLMTLENEKAMMCDDHIEKALDALCSNCKFNRQSRV